MINTSVVIESIQQDIKKKIDMEQKRLSDIQSALHSVQQFLLENGYEEIKETDDILEEVMKTIKKMKQQNAINNEDIDNIKKSIHSLKNIKNHIDIAIITSLEDKIREIEADIEENENKIISIRDSLNILLNLQIVCPVCNGNCSMLSSGAEEKRFNKGSPTTCNYCDGIGVLNIGKILVNEGIMEVDMLNIVNKSNNNGNNKMGKIPTPATDKLQSLQNQSVHNKYIINRQ